MNSHKNLRTKSQTILFGLSKRRAADRIPFPNALLINQIIYGLENRICAVPPKRLSSILQKYSFIRKNKSKRTSDFDSDSSSSCS